METEVLVLLALAGLLAGFVDSVVGGGGIITLPALIAAGMPPHLAVGTNKVVGTGASGIATFQYARFGLIVPAVANIAFPIAVASSIAGAAIILRLPDSFILGAVTLMMLAIIIYVLARPAFGKEDLFPGATMKVLLLVAGITLVAAFYDGLLGPGTGTFLLFGLVAFTGMPFIRAAANGRLINFGSNLGALLYFGLVGNVDWAVGGIMAIGTVAGGFLGSRAAVHNGSRWVRPLFVVVALVLLGRLIWALA